MVTMNSGSASETIAPSENAGRRPYRARRQPGEIEPAARAGKADQDQRDDRRRGRCVEPLPARDEEPGDDDRRRRRRRLGKRADRREAEPEQHAGEHRVGERRRDRRHQPAERTDQPGGDEQQADDQKGARRLGEAARRRAGRREQRARPASTTPPRSACGWRRSARCRRRPSRSPAPSGPTPPARRWPRPPKAP